jgi:hypothetical protein
MPVIQNNAAMVQSSESESTPEHLGGGVETFKLPLSTAKLLGYSDSWKRIVS